MKEQIKRVFEESIEVKQKALDWNLDAIEEAVELISEAIHAGKKIVIFGNGGSAADSQHMAAEFVGRFQKERRALPAVALTTDTSALTCLSNDYSFDIVFSRQIEALGREGDVAIAFSTSGNSSNVIRALETAGKMGMKSISMTGGDGGQVAVLSQVKLIVPSKVTARIQETHACMIHCLCELVENQFT